MRYCFLLCLCRLLAAVDVTISHEVDPPNPSDALSEAPGDLRDTSIARHFTIDHIMLVEPRQLPKGFDMNLLKEKIIKSCENGAFIDQPLELKNQQGHQRPAFMALLLSEGRIACFYSQQQNLPFATIFLFNDKSMRSVHYDSIFPITLEATQAPTP